MRSILAILLLLFPALAHAADARIVVKSVRVTDNGDNDGFADPNETVNLFLTLRNVSDTPRTGLVVALSTTDPTVSCVTSPLVYFGDLGARETREATTSVNFRVANVVRTDPMAELSAAFEVKIWGDGFDHLSVPQQVTLDLDLNVSGGSLPSTFTEGFEGSDFGTFTTMTLDVGKASLTLSDGYRCQYQDPDRTCGQTGSGCPPDYPCFLGFTNAADNAFDWHVHGLSSPDGGRAYLGNNSLHWGMHPGAADADTTRLKQLDALRTTLPINLGWNGVTSELSFKHQAGLVNCDYVNCTPPGVVDRGVVQVQLADSGGGGVGIWRKVHPYENLYDGQAVDVYSNCTFDPVDDGNTEDDLFEPPDGRLGPSSTCYPEFAFGSEGDTTAVFDPPPAGRHTDGPLLTGARGPGGWVQSKFSLDRWRGRRLRLRFLVTSIEVGTAVSMQQALGWNPIPADDGWYIDDIQVTNTLVNAATVLPDTADRSALPGCPAACSNVSAALTATPNPTGGPGQTSVLDASGSFADTCPGGPLLYRFWLDEDQDGGINSADTLARDWTDDPVFSISPYYTTSYLGEVRCSSRASCADHVATVVNVPCAATPPPFPETVQLDRNRMFWNSAFRVDVLYGDLDALRASGGAFQNTVIFCLADDFLTTGLLLAADPPPGGASYYLVRLGGPIATCNQTWGTGASRELPGVGGNRDDDLAADGNTCP